LFVIDAGVVSCHPNLANDIRAYFNHYTILSLVTEFILIPGGEIAKNNIKYLEKIFDAINHYGVDRHSYLAVIGGGAVLDLAGYAAATAHRGIRHIRIPTTVLSQNDSGMGVKNGINAYGKKNFIGTFCPPDGVFNDDQFLLTLSDRNWRAGISEAIKVSLIKDADFFHWIEINQPSLTKRDIKSMNYLVKRCAELHLDHIASGDAFERGSARPLDFGHWSAHKIEQLSNFEVLHGEAVAMGIALDTAYSLITRPFQKEQAYRIIDLLLAFGFDIDNPIAHITSTFCPLINGLTEFREHLGGKLTITILREIGEGMEIHHVSPFLLIKASDWLNQYCNHKLKIEKIGG
jgi:3-dehydroquinate synthase